MHWPGELMRRMRMLLHREQTAQELQEEMQLHLECREQQQVEAGATPPEARSAARRHFGNATYLRERSYESWGWGWLETLLQDVRYGLRAMLRSPLITLVALLSLALGIGANTAIFSLMDAVMLRSLPVKDPHQLVLLGTASDRGSVDGFDVTDLYSYPFYQLFQQRNRSFVSTAAMVSTDRAVHGFLPGHNQTVPIDVQLVSGTYFSTLGVSPAIGRTLNDSDNRIDDPQPVAVISDSWWNRAFARDPAILGRTVRIDATTYTIVGVTPPGFSGVEVGEAPELWLPLALMAAVPPHRTCVKTDLEQCMFIFGRLRPGVSLTQAATEVNLLRQQILPNFADAHLSPEDWKDLRGSHIPITSMAAGFSGLRHEYSAPLRTLMAIAALVLVIACANLANLLLARSTVRARELAVRQALGADRVRLVRQLLTESLVLAVTGGILGVVFARAVAHLLLRMVSPGLDRVPLDLSLNPRLLLFSLALTFATALVFGVLPALRAMRFDLITSLKDRQRTSGTRSAGVSAKILIVSQISFSIVLIVAASLFLRTFANLAHADTGFNRQNVLRVNFDLGSAGYAETDPRLATLYTTLEDRIAALPGVHAASLSSFTFNEGAWFGGVSVPGSPPVSDLTVNHNIVGNGYFQTMQIPLLAGRRFGPEDTATSQKVVIISEQIARRLFPNTSPIGRHYLTGGSTKDDEREIVGVVRDVKFDGVTQPTAPIDYIPYLQHSFYLRDLEVRYSGDDAAIATAVQHAIHEVNPHLPISRLTTLDQQVARSYTNQLVVAQLSTFFGLLAVFLSSIGIYGLMSYMVSRRTNEIGIRMALGAPRGQIAWLAMREVLMLVAIGIAIGVPITLAAARFINHLLFGLKGNDPFSLLAAALVMFAVAALAGYLPARRAARVNPMVALRYE